MELPGWVEALREKYLADAGNVFLLHGETTGATWNVDGTPLDCEQVLCAFLRRTREIVGVFRPATTPVRFDFADLSDQSRFENLVKAYELVEQAAPLLDDQPEQVLARIWRALSTTGTDQAYLITDVGRLAPRVRRTLPPPAAPELWDWPTHPTLLRSNNVVILLTRTVEDVRAELVERCVRIEVPRPDAPAAAPDVSAAPPVAGTPAAPEVELREQLASEVERALGEHPADHRAALLPVMLAVARVVHAHRPSFQVPAFALDAEGAATAAGPDAKRFLEAWRGDIALDAAGSMLVRNLAAKPDAGIDETAVGALARRVRRLLDRLGERAASGD
jgi:hypothetical protein